MCGTHTFGSQTPPPGPPPLDYIGARGGGVSERPYTIGGGGEYPPPSGPDGAMCGTHTFWSQTSSSSLMRGGGFRPPRRTRGGRFPAARPRHGLWARGLLGAVPHNGNDWRSSADLRRVSGLWHWPAPSPPPKCPVPRERPPCPIGVQGCRAAQPMDCDGVAQRTPAGNANR